MTHLHNMWVATDPLRPPGLLLLSAVHDSFLHAEQQSTSDVRACMLTVQRVEPLQL
jgi:hypothetical protein